MDNDFLATVHEIGSHRVRAQHGVAAWIVGDADGVETGMFRKGTGQYQDLTAAEVGNQAAGCGELGDGDEGLPTIEKIAKRMLSPRGGSHGLGHRISCVGKLVQASNKSTIVPVGGQGSWSVVAGDAILQYIIRTANKAARGCGVRTPACRVESSLFSTRV